MKKLFLISIVLLFLGCSSNEDTKKFILISNESIESNTVEIPIRKSSSGDSIKVFEDNRFIISKREEDMDIVVENLDLDNVYNTLVQYAQVPKSQFKITFANLNENYGGFTYADGTIELNYYHYSKNLDSIRHAIVHECVHVIQKDYSSFRNSWFNEGMAESIVHSYKGTLDNRIEEYNINDEPLSLLYFDWSDLNIARANYALSYFFFQYLISRTDNEYIINEMLKNKLTVDDVIEQYIDANLTFGRFMTEFRVALIKKELPLFDNIEIDIYDGDIAYLKGGTSVLIEFTEEFDFPEFENIEYVIIEPDK